MKTYQYNGKTMINGFTIGEIVNGIACLIVIIVAIASMVL